MSGGMFRHCVVRVHSLAMKSPPCNACLCHTTSQCIQQLRPVPIYILISKRQAIPGRLPEGNTVLRKPIRPFPAVVVGRGYRARMSLCRAVGLRTAQHDRLVVVQPPSHIISAQSTRLYANSAERLRDRYSGTCSCVYDRAPLSFFCGSPLPVSGYRPSSRAISGARHFPPIP